MAEIYPYVDPDSDERKRWDREWQEKHAGNWQPRRFDDERLVPRKPTSRALGHDNESVRVILAIELALNQGHQLSILSRSMPPKETP